MELFGQNPVICILPLMSKGINVSDKLQPVKQNHSLQFLSHAKSHNWHVTTEISANVFPSGNSLLTLTLLCSLLLVCCHQYLKI